MLSDKKKGEFCENQALKYFTNKQYSLLARNYRLYGVEIDLIFKKNHTYFFIEVKSDNLWRHEAPLGYTQKSRLQKTVSLFSEIHRVSSRLLLCIISNPIQIYPLDENLFNESF